MSSEHSNTPLESTPKISQKTNQGGNGIYEICHDISAKLGTTLGARTPKNDESTRTIMFDWSKKRLSHLLIQKGRKEGTIPEYIHSVDVLGQPSGAKRRNKIHQYHVDGENLRDVAEQYTQGEERCQTEIIDPIDKLLSEKLGIITRVDFWPKNIIVAPETAQKIKKSLKEGTSFDLDNEDAVYVNIDPDHWHFEGVKVNKLLTKRDIPIFSQLK